MATKQKNLLIFLAIILLLLVGLGVLYFQNKNFHLDNWNPSKIVSQDKQNRTFADIRNEFCFNSSSESDPNAPIDVKTFNEKVGNISQDEIFKNLTPEEFRNIRDYYYCVGLIKDNYQEACLNKMRYGDQGGQCKNGFYFIQMMLASLSGDKMNAERICRQGFGDDELCGYMVSFEDAKKMDVCSKLSENEKPACLALINGDDKMCKGSQREASCFLAAKFLRIVNKKDPGKCSELKSDDLADNYDLACELVLNKKQETCIKRYANFVQNFCQK